MIVNFDSIPEEKIENFVGGEGHVLAKRYIDNAGKIMKLTLPIGSSVGLHVHADNQEIAYIISGTGTHLYNGKKEEIVPGVAVYCPKGQEHSIINTGNEDLIFIAVVM
ncbi:MAG: cupin domain-containing protein [Ruminococcaceae bacterium]|nr:cupin domain-containing protein [Oscillospiraceae bacterium]